MAVEAIAHYLYKHKCKSNTKRLLLIALADRSNRDTGAAWPGVDTLADVIGVTPRHCQRLLADLEKDGEIMRAYNTAKSPGNKRGQWTNTYYLMSYRASIGLPLPKVSAMKTGKTPKPKRKPKDKKTRDPLFDAVALHVFDLPASEIPKQAGARIGMITAWLSGKKGRFKRGNKWLDFGEISGPAKAEHVRAFVDHWKSTRRGVSVPRDIEKFIEAWRAWGAAVSGKTAAAQSVDGGTTATPPRRVGLTWDEMKARDAKAQQEKEDAAAAALAAANSETGRNDATPKRWLGPNGQVLGGDISTQPDGQKG